MGDARIDIHEPTQRLLDPPKGKRGLRQTTEGNHARKATRRGDEDGKDNRHLAVSRGEE
jgi:hypothetical protein